MKVGEPNTLPRHPIDIRGRVAFCPKYADIAVSQIVGENNDDVWRARWRRGDRRRRGNQDCGHGGE